MDTLKLTLPLLNPSNHLLVETRPDKFADWLEELPSGNMKRYVTEVADAISYINRSEMPISQRIRLVQSVDLAYDKIHVFYRPMMILGPYKGKFPPKEEITEVNRLTKEMSFAYKTAVYGYIGKKKLFGKNKDLSNAINMALHYLGLILLEHYELYSPIPMHVWSEVHKLYNFAEQSELSELQVPQKVLKTCFDYVELTYIRICLISLSSPYHLKRGDHWEINNYLSYWTSQSLISEDSDDFSKKYCFIIDLESDDKPISTSKLEDSQNPNLRFILTKNLIKKMNQHIEKIKYTNRNPADCFSKNIVVRKAIQLLENMIANWEMRRERLDSRYPKFSKMEVIWGLNNIHKVLSSYDPLIPETPSNKELEVSSLIEVDWNTINISKGGICISQLKEIIWEVDVGTLVAIRHSINDEAPDKWILGIISWIKGNQRNGTQLGIEYINGDIQAVQLQARKGNKIETSFHAALMVSGESIMGLNTPTLLTSTGLYIESRPMVLKVGEDKQCIHARMKVNSSGSFDRFFYQPDTQDNPVKTESDEADHEKTDNNEIIDLCAVPEAPKKGDLDLSRQD